MTGTRAVSLHQPWASLVALGVKTIETRSWPAPADAVGERLLIHAAGRRPEGGLVGTWHVGAEGMSTAIPRMRIEALPLGAIVASCTLAACVPMVDGSEPYARAKGAQRIWRWEP